tara:strand:+ start:228 stop:1268 length:1041 start_codon:yes stop_codon:yes gene_type:complete
MTKKLPSEHRSQLQELNLKFRTNTQLLRKEARIEELAVIIGVIGAFVFLVGLFEPSMTTSGTGGAVFGLSLICALVGAWAFFAPASKREDRAENIILKDIKIKLDELGYSPDFLAGKVAFRDSNRMIDVYELNNYHDDEISPELTTDAINQNLIEIPNGARTVFDPDNYYGEHLNEDDKEVYETEIRWRLEETITGIRYYFKDGTHTQKKINLDSNCWPIFHDPIDAFNYIGTEREAPYYLVDGFVFAGLITELLENNKYNLIIHMMERGLTIKRLIQVGVSDDVKLDLKKNDLVLWKCSNVNSVISGVICYKAVFNGYGHGTPPSSPSPEYDFDWRGKDVSDLRK